MLQIIFPIAKIILAITRNKLYSICLMKSKVITYAEFERIAKKFPKCPKASFQASIEEYFVVEWEDGKNYPSRLVHYFKPIFG